MSDQFDYMKTTKDNLKNLIKGDKNNIIRNINDLVFKINKIVIHTYQFLKLFILTLLNR